ncbi:MAG: N-6 DNA methylase, partial [Devosia sp.]|nr:N-6 DNA methylase [Devosia sp.]
AADEARIARLAKEQPDRLYGGLLTVLLRLVFLLYAEDRGLIPSATDEEARRLYDQGYGVRALHAKLTADAARYPDTMEERRGAWARLLVLFRLVHKGGGGGFIMGRGGDLFDPAIYPFLLGQDAPGDPIAPAPVSDGTILGVLDKLLVLGGERLSYRTLDVEQIGSVYETVMGFTVETMHGPALALRGGKNDRVPVFVDLAELAVLKGSERQKRLRDLYDVKLPDKVAKAVAAAKTQAELEGALKPRVDERASPGAMLAAPGAPLLQPNDERRRTGSHYTPRDLTNPIVEHALEPAFERLGADAKPEEVLALRVCDPAMGSGAFLVEACRQLAARLVKAWTRWPETRPRIPDDEDEELHAKRLVAQRCLYGVDKNPRAVELAKLSLWLATLAREHEFTFLDHALKCGDSLVGLDAAQIAAMHWDTSKPGLPLFRKFVADRVAEATRARAEIQSAPDDTMRTVLEKKYQFVESQIELVRVLGDAAISAFFAEDKAKAREKRRATIESWVAGIGEAKWDELRAAAESLRAGERVLRPFHWTVEFPEVFARQNTGFDAFVGNPPFLAGSEISGSLGDPYLKWLQHHFGTKGQVDLVATFFLRAFDLIRNGGTFALLATQTISRGDTRAAGLERIVHGGGIIYRARRRIPWTGQAAVTVSAIWVRRGQGFGDPILDESKRPIITSFLLPSGPNTAPARISSNRSKAFEGVKYTGQGFLFSENGGEPETYASMDALIVDDPRNREVIRPLMRGEAFLERPDLSPDRYIIDFNDFPEDKAREWPALLSILERKVKASRAKGTKSENRPWWQFARTRPALRAATRGLSRVIMRPKISVHNVFAFVGSDILISAPHVAITREEMTAFSVIQSRVHEIWTINFGALLQDRFCYTPSDCFETFPFPDVLEADPALEGAGQTYHDHRAALMVARIEGMTKTYNRFHDLDERCEDIVRLRELHAEMDRAVLRAYGWNDLAERAEPIFLDETNEDDHTYQGRLFWPSAFRDEVLARLLALNASRHAEEVRLGIAPEIRAGVPEDEEDEEGDPVE